MRLLVMLASLALPAASQPPQLGPRASPTEVLIQGRISRINFGMARGMPSLEVVSAERDWKVWLGPMRYLVQNDFKPRAGQRVVIRAFRLAPETDELLAISVTISDTRQTLRLRDESGRPLWRWGGGGLRRGRGPGKSF